jgi:hypothetical protein
MKVTIISQNAQGLNDLTKVEILRNYFRPLLSNIEILCLQEHKLQGNRLLALKNQVWPQGKFYSQEAAAGNQVAAGCGGICMWVAPSIAHLVYAEGHSQSGQAQWVRF